MSTTAVLFPGQGSQEPNMGRLLAESDASAMELWQIAEKKSGLPLREVYWDGEGPEQNDTRYVQPALTAVNLGLWFAAKAKLSPMGVCGHSLGEFSALAACETLSVAEVFDIVALRGKLMSEAAVGGGMAAIVKLPQDAVEAMVAKAAADTGKILIVANYNSPAQFVVSGENEALDAVAVAAKAQKGRALPLPVSGAFHSPLMAEPAAELKKMLSGLDFRAPKIALYSAVTGGKCADEAAIKDAMVAQMTSGVRFIQVVEAMAKDGATRFVEVGPKGVLTKLAQAIGKEKGLELDCTGIPDAAAVAALA